MPCDNKCQYCGLEFRAKGKTRGGYTACPKCYVVERLKGKSVIDEEDKRLIDWYLGNMMFTEHVDDELIQDAVEYLKDFGVNVIIVQMEVDTHG